MIGPSERPDFREIDTPWEPQPITWIYTHGQLTRNPYDLRRQAANPDLQYLVREVEVQPKDDKSIDEALEELSEADEQFRQIEELTDLKVAPTTWHAFNDAQGFVRVLARVGIVEMGAQGNYHDVLLNQAPEFCFHARTELEFRNASDYTPRALHMNRLRPYFYSHTGRELVDIASPFQWQLGTLRDTTVGEGIESVYLVDIEPILSPASSLAGALPIDLRGERIT